MQITITENAKKLFNKYIEMHPNHEVFLNFEMYDKASSMDGVIEVKLIKDIENYYKIPTDWKQIYISKNSLDALDNQLIIDYPDVLMIKSPNRTYGTRMAVEVVA